MKKNILRVISSLLVLLTMVAMIPTTAFAETYYNVIVNGVEFSSSQKTISCGTGTAYLNTNTTPYTLTLNNANITKPYVSGATGSTINYGIYSAVNLNIVLVNTNTISFSKSNGTYAIYVAGKAEISGLGSLNIDIAGTAGSYGIICSSGNKLDIRGGIINIDAQTTSSAYACRAISANPLNIYGGDLTLYGKSSAFTYKPILDSSFAPDVYVGSNANGSSAAVWDKTTALNTYPFVHIYKGTGIWVNGTEFTTLSTSIPCGTGTATLNTSTSPYTIVLNNATISNTYTYTDNSVKNCGIYSKSAVDLAFYGTNKIAFSKSGSCYGVYSLGALRTYGAGTLDIDLSATAGCYGIIVSNNKINVDGGKIKISVDTSNSDYACRAISANPININEGDLTLYGMSSALVYKPVFASSYAPTVYVGSNENGSGASAWNKSTALNTYKFLHIYKGTGVWANGEEFSSYYKTIKCGSGTATLDTSTSPYKLTLSNANITNTVTKINGSSSRVCGIYSDVPLKIYITGSNSITNNSSNTNNYGVFANGALTYEGSGSLLINVTSNSTDKLVYGTRSTGGTTFNNGTYYIYANSNSRTYACRAIGGSATLKSGTFRLFGSSSAFDIKPTFSGYSPTVFVGNSKDGSNAAVWNKSDALNEFPFVHIGSLSVYSVSYNMNGGSGSIANQTKVHGFNLTLSNVVPTRSGYTFTGWNTKSDGTGTKYQPGATYTNNMSMTLYAQWRAQSIGTQVKRIAGGSRTQTAVEISKEGFSSASTVILADGDGYADSLAGVPLAYALDAPILLVRNSKLDNDTIAEINRLGANKVIILGGKLAISDDVKTALENMGCTVERIAGASRFDTAVEIAKKLEEINGKPSEVFFAYSHNYADALSVGGIAAVKEAPILYIAGNGVLSDGTKTYLQSSGANTAYILGGELAISNAAFDNIKAAGPSTVERVSGPSRYATCIAINEEFKSVLTGSAVCVATGTNFPDALAGGVFAAKNGAPLVLVPTALTNVQTDYISAKNPANIYIFGGTGAVSTEIENVLKGY